MSVLEANLPGMVRVKNLEIGLFLITAFFAGLFAASLMKNITGETFMLFAIIDLVALLWCIKVGIKQSRLIAGYNLVIKLWRDHFTNCTSLEGFLTEAFDDQHSPALDQTNRRKILLFMAAITRKNT